MAVSQSVKHYESGAHLELQSRLCPNPENLKANVQVRSSYNSRKSRGKTGHLGNRTNTGKFNLFSNTYNGHVSQSMPTHEYSEENPGLNLRRDLRRIPEPHAARRKLGVERN